MGERADEVVNLDPGVVDDAETAEVGAAPVGNAAGAYERDVTWGATTRSSSEIDAPTEDDDIAAARTRIEETRSQMSGTIDAIQDKLSPGNLAHQAKESVKDATIGRASDAVNSAGNTARGFGSTMVEAVRQNPVPAALAAVGLGWLFVSSRQQSSDTDYQSQTYGYYPRRHDYGRQPDYDYSRQYGYGYGSPSYSYQGGESSSTAGRAMDQAQNAVGNVAGQAQQLTGQAQDIANRAMGQAQEAAGQVASQVQDTAGQAVSRVQDTAGQVVNQAQYQTQRAASGFQQMMNEKPLAVAAGAVALGIAVGLSLPSTPQEDRLMGEARDSLMDQAQQTAQETAQKVQTVAQQAVGTAKEEAQNQFSE